MFRRGKRTHIVDDAEVHESVAGEDVAPADARTGFQRPTASDVDVESNIEWNRQRWGQEDGWRTHGSFGYRWG